MNEEAIGEALMKKALGYDAEDVVEEYVLDEDGCKKLNKLRVTKKHVPPDIPAAKVLLDHAAMREANELKNMTLDELLAERERLLDELKNTNCEIEEESDEN